MIRKKAKKTIKNQMKKASKKVERKPTKRKGAKKPPQTSESKSPLSFSVLVMSFAASALNALGQNLEESSGSLSSANSEMARFNIDLLMLLQEKTSGNLSDEEARFLSTVLYDLQSKFLQLTRV